MDSNVLRLLIRYIKGIATILEKQLDIDMKKNAKDKKFEDINAQSD